MMIVDSHNINGQRKEGYVSQQQARRDWLAARPDFIKTLPSDSQDVDDDGRANLDWVVSLMRADGLYSSKRITPQTTEICRDAVRRMVGQIRKKGGRP